MPRGYGKYKGITSLAHAILRTAPTPMDIQNFIYSLVLNLNFFSTSKLSIINWRNRYLPVKGLRLIRQASFHTVVILPTPSCLNIEMERLQSWLCLSPSRSHALCFSFLSFCWHGSFCLVELNKTPQLHHCVQTITSTDRPWMLQLGNVLIHVWNVLWLTWLNLITTFLKSFRDVDTNWQWNIEFSYNHLWTTIKSVSLPPSHVTCSQLL